MKIIKRDGREVPFEQDKIFRAIMKADAACREEGVRNCMATEDAVRLTGTVEKKCEKLGRSVGVEEIQDMIISGLVDAGFVHHALHYSDYRLRHEMLRKQNSTDNKATTLAAIPACF